MSRFDLLVKVLGYEEREAREILKAVDKEKEDHPDLYGQPSESPEGSTESEDTESEDSDDFDKESEQQEGYRQGYHSQSRIDRALAEALSDPAFGTLFQETKQVVEIVKDSLPTSSKRLGR